MSKDGEEAFNILWSQEESPDYIFLDINMPKVNGIECMALIKSDIRLRNIPVIFYSTTSNHNEVKKLITLGAEDFIHKSSSLEKLKESIYKVLKKKSIAQR